MGKKKTQKDQMPEYEQAVEQIEQIVEGIESGDIALEESLAQYERGMQLIAHCRTVLDRAAGKIEQLSVQADGELKADSQNAASESDTNAK